MGKTRPHFEVPRPGVYETLSGGINKILAPKLGGLHTVGAKNLRQLEGPALLAYVHRSWKDIPMLGASVMKEADIQLHWLTKQELVPDWHQEPKIVDRQKQRLVNWVVNSCGAITVDRSKTLDESVQGQIDEVLSNNGVLAWAPEGHRYAEDGYRVDPKHLKDSIAMVAMEHGVPIIGASVVGVLEGDEPGPVVVGFSEPLAVPRVEDTREALRLRRTLIMPSLRELLQDTVNVSIIARESLMPETR